MGVKTVRDFITIPNRNKCRDVALQRLYYNKCKDVALQRL